VLLSFAISGCDSSARQVIALTLVPNTIAPGFNSQVALVPTFSGGAAVIVLPALGVRISRLRPSASKRIAARVAGTKTYNADRDESIGRSSDHNMCGDTNKRSDIQHFAGESNGRA